MSCWWTKDSVAEHLHNADLVLPIWYFTNESHSACVYKGTVKLKWGDCSIVVLLAQRLLGDVSIFGTQLFYI